MSYYVVLTSQFNVCSTDVFRVDSKTVCMSMLAKADAPMMTKFCEFVTNRCGLGRGGEHAFVRWNMGFWDFHYNAADLEWTMLKTVASQCMLFFCDRFLYCLCPYFVWACYFLFGGLERADMHLDLKDFVFPALYDKKRDNVSKRFTQVIRDQINVDGLTKEQAKKCKDCYSSRSVRRGSKYDRKQSQS